MWSSEPLVRGKNICNRDYSLDLRSLTQGPGTRLYRDSLLWFLPDTFSCRRSVLVASNLFHQQAFCK